jgi:DNA replication and repair protein RecF
MYLDHLSLTNFRSYRRLELALPPGPTLLYGANAQGKTNLLEAVYYLATTRSHHAEQDSQLLNWDLGGEEGPLSVGRLVGHVARDDGDRLLEMRLIQEQQGAQITFRREALVNRRKVRLMDLLGNLRVVLFLPQDVQMVTGPPSERRRYMDITLCQTDPLYCRTLSRFNRLLEQRNAVLRRIAEEGRGHDVLPVFTEKLAEMGGYLFARRASFLAALARAARNIHYEALTEGMETLRLRYLPRLDGEENANGSSSEELQDEWAHWLETADVAAASKRFRESLEAARSRDMARGRTTVGPQRDDWTFLVNGRYLGSFGSRGQQRTAVLALKMAESNWMRAETGDTPVLLLDEVVAELDERRRTLILDYVRQSTQAILTATDPAMFSPSFLKEAHSLHVTGGQVEAGATVPDQP